MEHMPSPPIVSKLPDTVHTDNVAEVKLTVSPEVAEALTVNGAEPDATLPKGPKVIVWAFVLVMVNARTTEAAAAYAEFPP
jgi:hypothetical protein